MRPVVLIAHSLLWSNAARLSMACKNAGFSVAVIAPGEHPLHMMRSADRTFVYSPHNARGSLRKAIEASKARLIIPCDDRIVAHLHALHSESERKGDPLAKLIETSLGAPESYEVLRKRSHLLRLAALPGVRILQTDTVVSLASLRAWVAEHGLPAVLKLDGRTGGQDMILIADRVDVATAYVSMKLRQTALRSVWDAVKRRDVDLLLNQLRDGLPAMSVQSFVAGRAANCAVACWRGEVLGFVGVEAVRAQSTFGVATVVRRVEGRAMRVAAESIVRHLGISGMCGFDFMIDDRSLEPALIEINPRATQINHFPLGQGADLPTALFGALESRPIAAPSPTPPPETEIALFPQEWRRDRTSPYLAKPFHDAPYEEPDLLRYYGYNASPVEAGVASPPARDMVARLIGR